MPMKSIKEPLLKSIVSPEIGSSFILIIPNELSIQVRFQMLSFRIAIILVGFIPESFSFIVLLHVASRSSISILILVVWGVIGEGFAGSV